MPKLIKLPKNKTFEFKAATSSGQSKYNWDLLLDGSPYQISQGEDFHAPIDRDAMKGKAKTAGQKRYKKVKFSKFDAEGNKLAETDIILQAFPMTDDERAEEDMRRAEEKEKNKAWAQKKKAEAKAAKQTPTIAPGTEATPPQAASA
jgi:hypothetical protein